MNKSTKMDFTLLSYMVENFCGFLENQAFLVIHSVWAHKWVEEIHYFIPRGASSFSSYMGFL